MEQLMDKLIKAKAIMDMTESTSNKKTLSPEKVNSFNTPNVKYNIPTEFLHENNQNTNYESRVTNTKPVGVPTSEAIKNSKLPDEIKKLMLENPITQPQQQTTLSNELIEKASRLMKESSNNYKPESTIEKSKPQQDKLDYSVIKKMITEAVNDALKQNGLLVESTEKSSEFFSFKVGKHIFEGKISKIKKLS